MNSIHWIITLGLQEGYHTAQQTNMPISRIGEIYQDIAEQVYRETQVYISANIQSSKTLYRSEWGCPAGGEETVILSGCCNPVFTNPKAYVDVIKILANRLKKRFKQKTVMLEIINSNVLYLTDKTDIN